MGGQVAAGFQPVREAFAEVLAEQGGAGAGLAAWADGRWVVDLWGDAGDEPGARPAAPAFGPDTLVMPYSVTKPFAAVCLLLLIDRGLVDLDAPAQRYWPQLAAETTVRQLLSHQAGLVVLDRNAPTEVFYDWDLLCALLAAQPPAWTPGTAHGESALFYGHLVGEVVRRVDGRRPGAFLREEVCGPHGLDFHVGLTPDEQARTADLVGLDERFRAATRAGRAALYAQAIGNPPGAQDPAVVNSRAWRAAEVPAVNGHGTARAVAGLYVALLAGGLVSGELLREATTAQCSGVDAVFGVPNAWGLGFGVDEVGFGMGGLGGSYGGAAADGGYALGFVTALMNFVAIVACILGGWLAAVVVFGETSAGFVSTFSSNFALPDLVASVVKTSLFGFIIAIVCCYKGLNVKGGAEGVGRAVNQAVVTAFVGIWVFNSVFTFTLLAAFPELGNLH
jgi:CubicO group peptidase (beta-lactamase class C family)